MFKRKVYDKLLKWKTDWNGAYAVLLQGARRVGKTTIAAAFAQNEYQSHILIDFSSASKAILELFDDMSNLDIFFLRLQALTGVTLIQRQSVIIFDEIQLAPRVRQAIRHLVKDGRYDYIETGSLISIKKNVKGIVLPSEEIKIDMYPMDYEEFLWACESESYEILRHMVSLRVPIGNSVNRKLMREFRLYMAVGGMPQAVEAYLNRENFSEIDFIKREIISLYKDDFRKIDASGRISMIFDSIPAQLALKKKRFMLSGATGRSGSKKDLELLLDLIDSKTVLICYNTTKPEIALSQTKDLSCYKLYLADTGLFTTMLFNAEGETNSEIYTKLLSDKLEADLGYLYENAMAQIIKASGRELYYHTWRKENSTHSYEIDFLVSSHSRLIPVEVKSSGIKKHVSIDAFAKKYSSRIARMLLFSQKDISHDGMLELKPIYLAPAILESL